MTLLASQDKSSIPQWYIPAWSPTRKQDASRYLILSHCFLPMNPNNQNRPPQNGRPGGGPHEEQQRQPQQARSFTQYQSNSSKPFNAIPYSDEEADTIQGRLNKVLGPEYVSFRPGTGGQNVSYIEGWKALNLANDIFGFNGWSSELISVSVDFLDVHNNGRVSLGLSVVARITLKDGTFHEDFGYGFIENAKNKAMAFEKCKKEAFTDGLKRCLRCFGNVLGNCLYDKTIIAKMQKVKAPPRELEPSDFHRDPLVLKRETHLQQRRQQNAAQQAPAPQPRNIPNGPARIQDHNMLRSVSAPPKPHGKAGPLAIKPSDFKDLDDLFQFSDELGEEELNDRLDDYELQLLKNKEEESKQESDQSMRSDEADDANGATPSQVFFTSSKKALDVQKSQDPNSIPVYDHKFISSGVRRTIDPSKSVKVRRSDTAPQTPPAGTQSNVPSPQLGYGPGKRPLGMPPGQRQPLKRLHKDSDDAEKENKAVK